MFLPLGALILFYLLMALHLFTVWLAVLMRDTSVSPSEKPSHLMILSIITLLWPLVVPFAYLELLNAKNNVKSSYTRYAKRLAALDE